MDILTHTLSGVALGSCLALFSKKGWKNKMNILAFSGLGGALPDVDAISLWSKFDGSMGRLFGLSHAGKDIYSGKLWYSHHGFMHSLLSALCFTIVIGLILYLIRRIRKNKTAGLTGSFRGNALLLSGFFLGYIVHLFQDMVTPAGSWGGVRLFFPSTIYIGGTGDIWWWNNYDIFLIVVAVLVINLILLIYSGKGNGKIVKTSIMVLTIGCILSVLQIKSRDYNFNKKEYQLCEDKSKEIQKGILGNKIYTRMERFDRSLKIYF